jgi:type III restriction enzyme
VTAVDRLSIVAHDRFQEIVVEPARPESPIRMQSVILDPSELEHRTNGRLAVAGRQRPQYPAGPCLGNHQRGGSDEPRAFESPAEQEIARLAYDRIRALSTRALPLGSQEIADTASASLFRYDVNGDNLEVHSDFPVDLRVRQDSA